MQKFCQWGFAPCKVIQDSPRFWILHCGLQTTCQWNLDSTFQSLAGFWIPLTSGFQSPGLRIPRAKISHIPESWRDSESHWMVTTKDFLNVVILRFLVWRIIYRPMKFFLKRKSFFSIVALKEHVRGITGIISKRIRGLFGGISTLITFARFFPPLHTKASVFTFLFTLFRRDFLVIKAISSTRLSAPLRCKIKPF